VQHFPKRANKEFHQHNICPANKFGGVLGCKQLSHDCSQHSQMECPLPAATKEICVPVPTFPLILFVQNRNADCDFQHFVFEINML
jgi:hypothetical protein